MDATKKVIQDIVTYSIPIINSLDTSPICSSWFIKRRFDKLYRINRDHVMIIKKVFYFNSPINECIRIYVSINRGVCPNISRL